MSLDAQGLARTPKPPYYAVVFTSIRSDAYDDGYATTSTEMARLAAVQSGYLGIESARDQGGLGITVSYWETLESIRAWKNQVDHLVAQRLGREKWYRAYALRICKVERAYDFP
jgi:heme-degrading monooxygenase HmoA